ncbi:response regulator [Candidatus Falkowbacteria bacterium]|uniref:Response regulator n=1 Tax=Candidatus Buchananbacteria bacterium CG10_big_fil_rev_8_21_14_0_10_33_19 TaxID=1974525 RepID=A0A2H0W6I0_9BACT|nr:response regulator [Candidatus Falkowbacteria bacterium]PIS06211.1 MAG: response regulator [Candidatus Buchananbacteria bacterium CG10_big_fil_rev_8_21_14_0_10_33_19]
MVIFGRKTSVKNKKILLVEDDALLAKALMDLLIREDFDVANANNGLQVYDLASKFQPHLILLDLILPGLDGFEVLRQLKDDDKLKTVPVFIISNLDSISEVKSAKALGAEDYFIKANTDMFKIIKAVKARVK